MHLFMWIILSVKVRATLSEDFLKKRPTGIAQISLLPGRLMIQFERVSLCDDHSQLVALEDFKIHWLSSSVTTFSGRVEALENLGNLTKGIVHIQKCTSSALSTYEHFQSWRFGNEFCEMLNAKNQLWTPMISAFHPAYHCPYHKGIYRIDNATIDTFVFQYWPLPVEKFYWRTRTKLYNHELWSCSVAEFKFFRVRHYRT